MEIKKVGVIGSGVMGAGIAAHLANAGIPSLLLDIVPKFSDADAKVGLKPEDPNFRDKLALRAIQEFIADSKPALIYSKSDLKLITPGNTEDHLSQLKDCDWVVEVVTERLDIKQRVFENVEKNIRPGTIISSNTSGIPLKDMAEGRGDAFRKHFIITHFFNPVRYMKLVEVVSGPETNPQILSTMIDFLENTLGKGVVYAKDTPNFVANRIGVYSWMSVLRDAIEDGLKVEEVDKIVGPAMGRPKTAAFRTADMVGIDTIAHVAKNTHEKCIHDEQRDVFQIPPQLQTIVERNWLGGKTGQGFYKKSKGADGQNEILSLNLKTLDYEPQIQVRYDSLGATKGVEGLNEKIKALIQFDDKAGKFAWKVLSKTLVYAAERLPEIADDVVNVDNAMKWGFNWDQGPFETWDALGVAALADRLKQEGRRIPKLVQDVLSKGGGCFYKSDQGRRLYFDQVTGTYKEVPASRAHISIQTLKDEGRELKKNTGASLIDLGDGVLCVEFHTKMNAIDHDIGEMVNAALDLLEKDNNYVGLVLGNDGQNFSAGANLMLLWLESQQKNWDNIIKLVKGFQDTTQRLKYFKKPVVAAPFGLALGGGCEISMACHRVRMHGELYMGLVEVGAGLIPGGAGNLRVLLNIEAARKAKGATGWAGLSDGGPFPKVQDAFQTIAFAKVSMSCKEAIKLHYLKTTDRITISRDRLLYDAKQDVLEMVGAGFDPGQPREDILVPGEGGFMAIENAIGNFRLQGLISEHDALIARKLGYVLCGGALPNQGLVSEQYLLDLEREKFLELCGEEKSQARMQHLLMKGKPLRN